MEVALLQRIEKGGGLLTNFTGDSAWPHEPGNVVGNYAFVTRDRYGLIDRRI